MGGYALAGPRPPLLHPTPLASPVFGPLFGPRWRRLEAWGAPKITTQLASALALRRCMVEDPDQRDRLKKELRPGVGLSTVRVGLKLLGVGLCATGNGTCSGPGQETNNIYTKFWVKNKKSKSTVNIVCFKTLLPCF